MYSNELLQTLDRLDELTDWEHRPRDKMCVGLEPMLDLMRRLGNPHRTFRVVHVTGTKGKGSVCALIEAALQKAGLAVGRYASPHLHRINERIGIRGNPVSDRELSRAVSIVLDVYEEACDACTDGARATWFDIVTAAAFLIFQRAGLEWVVVEVGLGGRLDSTNVVDGEVAVVTNVELEHTEVLGRTRAEIAGEKVGILKRGATLVTSIPSRDEAGKVLRTRAVELGCNVVYVPTCSDRSIADANARIACVALNDLGRRNVMTRTKRENPQRIGWWLLDDATRASARLPGRLERMTVCGGATRPVSVVMDGAHVPFNLSAVMRDVVRQPGLTDRCIAVVAMANDKDARGLLSALKGYTSHIIFTNLPPAGGMSCTTLRSIASSLGISSEVQPILTTAVAHSIELAARESRWVIVTGSLHLVGAARREVEHLSTQSPLRAVRSLGIRGNSGAIEGRVQLDR